MPIQIFMIEPLYCSHAATQNVEEPDAKVDSTQSENTHEEWMIISDLHVPFSDYECKAI